MSVFVARNGHYVSYEPDYFWFLAQTKQLLRSDQVFDPGTNQFLRADRFADVEPYLPSKSLGEILEDIIGVAVGVGVVLFVGAAAAQVFDSAFGSNSPASPRKRCQPNYEPLEGWKRRLVRERDAETCTY